jgi:hypothetical protein
MREQYLRRQTSLIASNASVMRLAFASEGQSKKI